MPTGRVHVYADRLIGRDAELSRIAEAFGRGARLVTLLGPPGVGKTRLAVEFVHQAERAEQLPGFFVDLTEASTVDGICRRVAAALDIALIAGRSVQDPTAHLAEVLARRGRVLVVLDNFEHLVAHAAATVGHWVASAPELQVLVTSRERLRLGGERVVELDPLSLPDTESNPANSAAVQLFVERVRALRPRFTIADRDAPTVAAIVRSLDGVPLAIELAASRMRVLSLAELLTHLSARFELLARSDSAVATPHETLEGAIAWSWALLKPWEQAALAQCSVFRGGFTAGSALEVVTLPRGKDVPPVLDVLQALRDKSLLRMREPEPPSESARLEMFDSIREFARRRLASSKSHDEAAERHAKHFLARAQGWLRDSNGPSALEAREGLASEMDNVLAAHEWIATSKWSHAHKSQARTDIALATDVILSSRGPGALHVRLLDAAVDGWNSDAGDVSTDAFVRTLAARADALQRAGRIEDARRDLDRARDRATRDDDRLSLARAALADGRWHWSQGHLRDAEAQFRMAVQLAAGSSDGSLEAFSLNALALSRQLGGNVDESEELYQRALSSAQRAQDIVAEGTVLANQGSLAFDRGETERAAGLLERAVAIFRSTGDRRREANVLADLATIAQENGDLDLARERFEAAVRYTRECGVQPTEALWLYYLGGCEERAGDRAKARERYTQSIELARRAHNLIAEGLALAGLGRLEADADQVASAQRSIDAAIECFEIAQDAVRWEVAYLCGGHLELALARAADADGRHDEAARLRQHARERASSSRRPRIRTAAPSSQPPSFADRSADVRGALAYLEARLPATDAGPLLPRTMVPPAPTGPNVDAALLVAKDGAWFRPPGADRVSLRTRGSMRLLIAYLAQRRLDAPGAASDVEALFAAGWPGERAAPQSRASRVYVALSTLRGLGLRGILERQHDGYVLATGVEVVMA